MMNRAGSWRCGLCIAAAILLSSAALAENEALTKAKRLFDQKQYVTAQDALLKIEKKDLSEEETKEYDRLMKALPGAIQGSKKAEQDSADAAKAYDEARWDDADKLYAAIVANEHASPVLVDDATTQRQKIAEKRQLGEAVKPAAPNAPVGGEPTAAPAATTDAPAAPVAAPMGPSRLTPIDEMIMRDSLLWQRAQTKSMELQQRAEVAVSEKRYEDARNFCAAAIQQLEANRAVAPSGEAYGGAVRAAEDFKRSIDEQIGMSMSSDAALQQENIRKQIELRRINQERQRREKIDQLFLTAKQLNRERAYSDAAENMRQVLILEPANAAAANNLELYEELSSLAEQGRIGMEYQRQMQGALLETDESKIPWYQDILYPRNWLEITRKRDLEFGGVRPDDSAERNMKLEERIPEIGFNDMPLDRALDSLRAATNVNLAVDWNDLEGNGVERTRPISLNLKDVTFRTALREVLNQASTQAPIGFSPRGDVLQIASRTKLDRNKYTQVYDIRDLIIDIPKFSNSPTLDINVTNNKRSSFDIFRDNDDRALIDGSSASAGEHTLSGTTAAKRDEHMLASLLDTIRTTVAPDSWRESGGGDAAMRELNGQLVVYQTSESQQQVRDLLKQLRDTRALMIGVEARFLIVGSNFLNEIGVDLDFVFNQGTAGFDPATNTSGQAVTNPFTGAPVLIPRQYSRLGALPAIPGVGGAQNGLTPVQQPYGHPGLVPQPGGVIPSFNEMTPIGMQQSSFNLVDPRTISTGIPGTWGQAAAASPALNIVGSFLDNLQVDFLIRATQANRRSSIVQAPRLMMFNGQRAWVAVVNNRQYVSSVTPNVAEGAVGVAPVIGNVQSGTSLDIEGTISHDKKYVTLTVRTGLANEPTITPFETQRGSGNSPSIFVSLTQQEIRAIRTTVSVPDGGTVLIGGLKQTGEIEVEAGVPILSKIPVLKRAFTNTTMVKDTQTLLILLKAKILIQKEAEDEAFPTMAGG